MLRKLWPEMPEDQRAATRIWFSFYPLLLENLPGPNEKAFRDFFQVKGSFRLAESVDTSHSFHGRHAEWPKVKAMLRTLLPGATLEATIRAVGVDLGLAAIALMTLRQVGEEAFFATSGEVVAPAPVKDSWLRRWTAKRHGPRIIFDRHDREGWFPIIPSQEITTAAEQDKRPYQHRDPRCVDGMGPIPVDCKSGSCGTCWVGVLEGNEQLGPVTEYERKRMEYFGYWDCGFEDKQDERPLIRLACQTQAFGTATIVIPPWCGVWGASRRDRWRA